MIAMDNYDREDCIMNRENMLKLADIIEAQPVADREQKTGFNMSHYCNIGTIELFGHKCKTPSCIAGWCRVIATEGQVMRWLVAGGSDAHGLGLAVLGLTRDQGCLLFTPDGDYESIFHEHEDMPAFDDDEWSYGEITPKIAADTLRRLANGTLTFEGLRV